MWSIEKSNKIIISTIIIYFLLVSSCIVLLIVSYRMTISNYFSRFHDSIYSIWIRLNSLSIWRENVLKKTEIRRVMIRRNGWKRMECRQSSQKCSALSLISLRRAQTVQPCQRNMKYRDEIWAKLITIPAFEIQQDSFETTHSIRFLLLFTHLEFRLTIFSPHNAYNRFK